MAAMRAIPQILFDSTVVVAAVNMNRRNYSWDLPAKIEKRIGPNTYGRQRIIQDKGVACEAK